jgi:predicted phosphodiesterase
VELIKKIQEKVQVLFIIKTIAVSLTALTTAILAVWLLGVSTVEVEGIEFKVGLAPNKNGITELHFPPFGVVEANTHQGPVKLMISLEQIQSDSLKAHLDDPPNQQELVKQLQDGAKEKVSIFLLRQVAVAVISSFLLVFLIWRLGLVKSLIHSTVTTLVLLLILTGVIRSFNISAFHEPEYEGVLTMAPAVVKFASDSLTDLQEIREHTREIVSNLGMLFSSADSLMAMANPEEQGKVIKVLLVSDLHSNPVGIDLIKSLANRFMVDFIINAGDLTDMGLAVETSNIQDLVEIEVPQLFVGGNHDSPEIMDFIAEVPGGHILDGKMFILKGIKILGFPDPLSAVSSVQYNSPQEREEALKEQLVQVRDTIEVQGRPDILVVHDPVLAKKLTKLSDLIVAGHDHRIRIEQGPGWVFINPGTAGASGLRGLYSEKGTSYSASVVYIMPDSGILAVDVVQYNPVSKHFSLERKLLNQ